MGLPESSVSISRRPPDIEDYIDMFRRYRAWIIGPTFLGLVVSVVIAFLWPDTYVSQAVMRITPQQVSERLLPAVISTQMADRIGQMEQEILSRSSLSQIIQKPSLDLYKQERARLPMEDIIQDMKNKYVRIRLLNNTNVGSANSNRYASAFAIQFSYNDRYKAQAVVSELVAKFMEQNVTVQRNKAQLTDSFLSDELRGAREKVTEMENALTKFRMDNQGRLPEQVQANMQALNNVQLQITAVDDALSRDHQDKLILETRLQNVKNSQSYVSSNMEETGPAQTVKNQRLIELNNRIADAKSNLAALRQVYKDNYPDVQQFKARIATLEQERDELERQQQQVAPTAPTRVVNSQMARNLEDLKNEQETIKAQLAAKQENIEAKIRRQAELNRLLASYQGRIEGGTAIEQQYAALVRDYNLAKADYEDMSKRKGVSETAKNLEEHKAGENLEVLDPASLPEQPAEPNRLAIAAMGTGVGLMVGFVLAGAKEVKNTSLKNLKDVRAYTNLPVLTSIPLLENALLLRRKRRLFWLAWTSAVMVGIVAMSGSMYYYFFGRN